MDASKKRLQHTIIVQSYKDNGFTGYEFAPVELKEKGQLYLQGFLPYIYTPLERDTLYIPNQPLSSEFR